MLLEEDILRLRHMLDAAREAIGFASGRSRSDLDTDRMLAFAIVRAVEVVGEAASKIRPESKAALSCIPWPGITAMRNRLVHADFDIDLDRVWDTAVDDLPLWSVNWKPSWNGMISRTDLGRARRTGTAISVDFTGLFSTRT